MQDIEIYKTAYCGIAAIYPDLYSKIFHDVFEDHTPDFVYIAYVNKEYAGFLSAYTHSTDCVYIQYAGFADGFKGYYAPGLFKKVVDYIHKEYKGIMFRIENTNVKAIKVALNAGFLITGIRFDGVVYVELIKVKEI